MKEAIGGIYDARGQFDWLRHLVSQIVASSPCILGPGLAKSSCRNSSVAPVSAPSFSAQAWRLGKVFPRSELLVR